MKKKHKNHKSRSPLLGNRGKDFFEGGHILAGHLAERGKKAEFWTH